MAMSLNKGGHVRFADYFVIAGLDYRDGLELEKSESSIDKFPLQCSYKGKVLENYPKNISWNPFDAQGLYMLSLPNGIQFATQKSIPTPKFHSFATTREDGKRCYGFSLIFYEELENENICSAIHTLQAMYITDITNKHSSKQTCKTYTSTSKSLPRQLKIGNPAHISDTSFYDINKDKLFVSKSISLICQFPYVFVSKIFLNNLYKCLPRGPDALLSLESYVYNIIFHAIVPNPGCSANIYLPPENAALNPIEISISRPEQLTILDYPVKLLFKYLDIDIVIDLFTCILMEYQILLYSSDYEKLTLIAECITSFIFPFTWSHVYAPILPLSLHHFLDAPVPYIMGISTDIQDIKMGERTCLLVIEENRIKVRTQFPEFPIKKSLKKEICSILNRYSKNPEFSSNNQRLQNSGHFPKIFSFRTLPSGKSAQALLSSNQQKPNTQQRRNIDNLDTNLSSNKSSNLHDDYNENLSFNLAVREIFIEHLVSILIDYESYIIYPKKNILVGENMETTLNFDKLAFISDHLDNKDFFTKFVESQMFASFIDDKILSSRSDNFKNNILYFDQRIKKRKLGKTNATLTYARQHSTTKIQEPREILPNKSNQINLKHFPLLNSNVFNTNAERHITTNTKQRKAPHIVSETNSLSLEKGAMSPSLIAKANWNFVEQLLHEIKLEIKLMISNDEHVSKEKQLSTSFYDILEKIWNHGLQIKQGSSAIWSHISLYLRTSKNMESSKASYNMKSDIRNILNLTIIKTDSGYAKAWIRLALEKKCLSQYFHTLLSEEFLLKTLYKRSSFLRSEDEREQFLYHVLSLSTVDYNCFTNSYPTAKLSYEIKLTTQREFLKSMELEIIGTFSKVTITLKSLEKTILIKNIGLISNINMNTDTEDVHIRITNKLTNRVFSKSILAKSTHNLEFTPLKVQEYLCQSVHNIVKWHQSSSKDKNSKQLNSLLCSDGGLVHCIQLVFNVGIKANTYHKDDDLWQLIVKFKNDIEILIKNETTKRTFHYFIEKLNLLFCQNKFRVFVCLCTREKILIEIILQIGLCFVDNGIYNDTSFFKKKGLLTFLENILKPLDEIHFILDDEITEGIQFPSII